MSEWTVWGDDTEPVATHLTYDAMRAEVDNDDTGTLYGEDDNGDTYVG